MLNGKDARIVQSLVDCKKPDLPEDFGLLIPLKYDDPSMQGAVARLIPDGGAFKGYYEVTPYISPNLKNNNYFTIPEDIPEEFEDALKEDLPYYGSNAVEYFNEIKHLTQESCKKLMQEPQVLTAYVRAYDAGVTSNLYLGSVHNVWAKFWIVASMEDPRDGLKSHIKEIEDKLDFAHLESVRIKY